MTLRLLDQDENYGNIGFGNMTMSGVDTYSSAQLPTLAEPTFIVTKKDKGRRSIIDVDIEDVFVWDNRKWNVRLAHSPPVTGNENQLYEATAGITLDNTSDSSNGPTAASIAQGTFPGGNGASVTGTAGVTGSARMVGQDKPEMVEFFDFGQQVNEEQSAVGHINISGVQRTPINYRENQTYEVNGHNVSYLMTAAHYWAWADTGGPTAAAGILNLGASVRKVSIDLEELLFDRNTVFSILDALEILSGS